MKKWLALLLMGWALPAAAQFSISQLPPATTPLTGTEVFPCTQSGATKKCLTGSVAVTGLGFSVGNQAPVSGSKLKIDNQIQQNALFPVENEGGIWSSAGYAYSAISQTVDGTTVSGQGSSGPLMGLFAFLNNNGATAPAVANLGDCVARIAGGTCFGANFIARNANVNGTKLVGAELDMEPTAGTTIAASSTGLVLNTFNATSAGTAVQVGSVGGGSWLNGLLTSNIAGTHYGVVSGDPVTSNTFIDTRNGTFANASIVVGSSASQGIAFGGTSFVTRPYVYNDGADNLLIHGAQGVLITAPNGLIQQTALGVVARLGIVGNGNTFGTSEFSITQNTSNEATLINRSNAALRLGTNNTDHMDINGPGDVTINVPASGTAFTVTGVSGQLAVSATQPVGLPTFTVGTLPACNTTLKGGLAYVTDAAAAPVYNATVASGGAVIIPVFCNGTNWTNH